VVRSAPPCHLYQHLPKESCKHHGQPYLAGAGIAPSLPTICPQEELAERVQGDTLIRWLPEHRYNHVGRVEVWPRGVPGAGAAAEHKVWGLLMENHPQVPSPGSSPTSTPSALLLLTPRSHQPFRDQDWVTSPVSWLQAMKQTDRAFGQRANPALMPPCARHHGNWCAELITSSHNV